MSRGVRSESALIDWIRRRARRGSDVRIGIGDDTALVSSRRQVLVTTDMLLDGIHFRSNVDPPRRIGWKAMACNLSDIAAMGGRPTVAVVAVGLPKRFPARSTHALLGGLLEAAARFGVRIVGGDTNASRSGVIVAVTLLGECDGRPLTRSGARVGDAVCVTGTLGGSILGKHLRFLPRIAEALDLKRHHRIHAMMDVSDGLLLDTSRLARASGVGIALEEARIPVSAAATRLSRRTGRSPLQHALSDGEDFELLFTLPMGEARRLVEGSRFGGLVSRIGEVVRSGLHLVGSNGRWRAVRPRGYEHFGSQRSRP